MDITYLGAIVALIGLVASAVGTVVGAKVSIKLLQAAHDRFEDAVWKAIDGERAERGLIAGRVSKIEGICEATRNKGGCP